MARYQNNTKEIIHVIISKDSNGVPAWVFIKPRDFVELDDAAYAQKAGLSVTEKADDPKPEIKAKPKPELKPKKAKTYI